MLDIEQQVKAQGHNLVIGVDEAGRGPLAGPVVASAVSLKNNSFVNEIRDSKKLTPRQRERAFHEIFEHGYVGIGIVSESAIDQMNILEATFHAMNMAVSDLIRKIPPEEKQTSGFDNQVCLLIDGNRFKSDLPYKHRTVIQGDKNVLSIACASIIAKVTRDRILLAYDKIMPEYGFKKHKGYPTAAHRKAIEEFGYSIIHRRSFHLKSA